jgi:hypothetical protein
MKSLWNESDRQELHERIAVLNADRKPLWGE